jgi:hypothetical protein
MADQRHLHGLPVGAMPGSIQSTSTVWVKLMMSISSTIWFAPTVREMGRSRVSGGVVGMKWCL